MNNSTIRVLLVDDDTEFAGLVRHHLNSFQNKQFDLSHVTDGDAAILEAKNSPGFDVVLMDYFLPGENGLDIARRFAEGQLDLPIILLTSNKDFRVAIEAMKYGIEEYLIKERAGDTLLPRTIINTVERSRLKHQVKEAEMNKLISQKKTEAVQELVVTMCHEFNNPLAAIKISTDILSRQKISEEEQELLTQLNRNISLLEKQIIGLRDLNTQKRE